MPSAVRAAWACLIVGCIAAPAHAVIFYDTGDPSHNTTAPTGPLANSGWQYEGQFDGFLGTPISSNYFITAAHIGGAIGDTFSFDSGTYQTTAVFSDPNSDLRIWQVDHAFPAGSWAPLYTGSSETGKSMVVIGRGTERGDPVLLNSSDSSTQRGWFWGNDTRVQRWGSTAVSGINTDSTTGHQFVTFTFNGPGSVTLSSGDSGGGVFVLDTDNVWKLAGINFGVDGPYKFQDTDPSSFNAAIYDMRGLWEETNDMPVTFTYIDPATNPDPVPADSYATRISSELAWIDSTTGVPEPGAITLLGMAAVWACRGRGRARARRM